MTWFLWILNCKKWKEIKQTNPDAKVLVFTGMIIDIIEFKKICPSFEEKQLIQKPVRMNSLIKKINEAMTSI